MSIDFAALTQAVVAGLSDVRSCLIVSRDGLALGASPATEEGRSLDVWTRIASLGDVERGFVTVRDEVWVFCRRGAYGTVAIAASTARPGVILDTLEQTVLTAEEARVRKEGLRLPAERDSASVETPRGLRTPLHRDRTSADEATKEPITAEAQEAAVAAWSKRIVGSRRVEPPAPDATEPQAEPDVVASKDSPEASREEPGFVDRVELSREFAGLLAEIEEPEA
jgi:hypothetical protein